jgi:hypothetical protein
MIVVIDQRNRRLETRWWWLRGSARSGQAGWTPKEGRARIAACLRSNKNVQWSRDVHVFVAVAGR